jgi:hypothetical protein
MTIDEVMHSASFKHGLSGDFEGKAPFEPETERSVRWLLERGHIERRERVVDLKPSSYAGNWPALQPVGLTKIVTWHLTPSGRDFWLYGSKKA